MNYTDTKKSVSLVLETGEVPLIVGESGIGKTALAKDLAKENKWSLIVIDANLLKEGEIGGLPTVETYTYLDENNQEKTSKITIYAIHHKLRQIQEEIEKGKTVLLFIDEINRCEHTVQQELMNLILNREINGFHLEESVRILAAMNPSNKYGESSDYQVVDMDAAQENRFVWLSMEADYMQWLSWAIDYGIEEKVVEFISTFPEYLNKKSEDAVQATPRSYERISKTYRVFKENKETIERSIFLNVLAGNVGKMIAQEFLSFIETNHRLLISYKDIFEIESLSEELIQTIQAETHTRLYLSAKNILKTLEAKLQEEHIVAIDSIQRLIELIQLYPLDLRIGIMKEIKSSYPIVYRHAIEQETFVNLYFDAYASIRG